MAGRSNGNFAWLLACVFAGWLGCRFLPSDSGRMLAAAIAASAASVVVCYCSVIAGIGIRFLLGFSEKDIFLKHVEGWLF